MDPFNSSIKTVGKPADAIISENLELDPTVKFKLGEIRKKIFKDFTNEDEGTVRNKNPFWGSWVDNLAGNISWLASAVTTTFAPGMTNQGIDFVFALLYPKPVAEPTWWDSFTNSGTHLALDSAALAAKLALTPEVLRVLPLAMSGLAFSGVHGIALLAAGAYTLKYGREKSAQLPDLDKLIMFDEKKGTFVNSEGRALNDTVLNDIFHTLMKFNLVCKLQECKSNQVKEVIDQYVKLIEDDKNIDNAEKAKVRKKADKLIDRISCAAYVGIEKLHKPMDYIVKKVARKECKKFCLTSPQLLKISESFNHLNNMLVVPVLPKAEMNVPKQKISWDDEKNRIAKRDQSTYFNQVWYLVKGKSTADAAKQLKANLSKALVDEFKIVDVELENLIKAKQLSEISLDATADASSGSENVEAPIDLSNIDEDVKTFIQKQTQSVRDSFNGFFYGMATVHKGENLQSACSEMLVEYLAVEQKLLHRLQPQSALSQESKIVGDRVEPYESDSESEEESSDIDEATRIHLGKMRGEATNAELLEVETSLKSAESSQELPIETESALMEDFLQNIQTGSIQKSNIEQLFEEPLEDEPKSSVQKNGYEEFKSLSKSLIKPQRNDFELFKASTVEFENDELDLDAELQDLIAGEDLRMYQRLAQLNPTADLSDFPDVPTRDITKKDKVPAFVRG